MGRVYFTSDHEWIKLEGDTATVGITNNAQDQLGDLVFVELPNEGRQFYKGEAVVVVESVKAASDVYAPVDGTITQVNSNLTSQPELVNSNPMDEGWLFKMKLADSYQLEDMMDEASYLKFIS